MLKPKLTCVNPKKQTPKWVYSCKESKKAAIEKLTRLALCNISGRKTSRSRSKNLFRV